MNEKKNNLEYDKTLKELKCDVLFFICNKIQLVFYNSGDNYK